MPQIEGSSNTAIRAYRSAYGAIAIREYEQSTCASSKTIQVGDIVSVNTVVSTAFWVVMAPSSQGQVGNLLENGGASILGVCVGLTPGYDGSTSGHLPSTVNAAQTRRVSVAIADGLTEFSINISSVGATPQVVCSSLIGGTYPVECVRTAVGERGGHGVWFLSSTNLSTAADLSFVVTDVPTDQIGTSGGYVVGKFLSTMCHRSVRVGGPTVSV
jgi:hypothetical protein